MPLAKVTYSYNPQDALIIQLFDGQETSNLRLIENFCKYHHRPLELFAALKPMPYEPEPRHPDLNLERDMPCSWVYLITPYIE